MDIYDPAYALVEPEHATYYRTNTGTLLAIRMDRNGNVKASLDDSEVNRIAEAVCRMLVEHNLL